MPDNVLIKNWLDKSDTVIFECVHGLFRCGTNRSRKGGVLAVLTESHELTPFLGFRQCRTRAIVSATVALSVNTAEYASFPAFIASGFNSVEDKKAITSFISNPPRSDFLTNNHTPLPMTSKRAFTLVELLIVVAIIGILASITLAALSQAQGQAKVYRTQTTIAKINDALTEVYERFEFRAKPWMLTPTGACSSGTVGCIAHPNSARLKSTVENRIRYLLLRAEMLAEMPQCATDVTTPTAWRPEFKVCPFHTAVDYASIIPTPTTLAFAIADAGAAANAYQDAIGIAWTDPNTTHVADTVAAELLYLIIETNNPEALAGFKGGEIGDTDGDGLFEFIDAWGNPIRFLRYAPGLQEGVLRVSIPGGDVETTRLGQPVLPADELNTFVTSSGTTLSATMTAVMNSASFRDPLYPQQGTDPINPSVMPLGLVKLQWPTFPVIYSCGADKRSGIVEPDPTVPVTGTIADILPISQATYILYGSPDNSGEHADNITNHNMVKPF